MSLFTYVNESEVETLEPIFKKPMSDEHRAKISNSRKGMTFSDEHRANMSASHKGTKHSEETRAKIGAAHKGKKISKETRAKMSEANKHKKRWVYYTPNGVFKRAKEAAKANGISYQAMMARCTRSKSIRYSDFYRIKDE